MLEKIEAAGLEVNYISRWKEYDIKINKIEEFTKNKDLLIDVVKTAMDYYNINE